MYRSLISWLVAHRGTRELANTGRSGTGEVAGLSDSAAGSGEDDAEGDFLNTRLYSRSSSVSSFGVTISGKLSTVLLRDTLDEDEGRRCTARDNAGDDGDLLGALLMLPGVLLLAADSPDFRRLVLAWVDGCSVLLLCLKETLTYRPDGGFDFGLVRSRFAG